MWEICVCVHSDFSSSCFCCYECTSVHYLCLCVRERTPSSHSQQVLLFTALMCSMIQHKGANHANTDPPSPRDAQCVCLKVHRGYLSRLCGSIIRINSTCYPGLCVSIQHRSGSQVFLLCVRPAGVREGGFCVFVLKPVLLLFTHTHTPAHIKGNCRSV